MALVVAPRRFATLEDILARAAERGEAPFVLALDSLEDPQNVGTLLRSAEAAGVHGILFPTRRQAPLTPSAVKASAGAVEHLLLCPVDDLAGALADLRAHGLRVAGAEADAPLTARQSDLRGPLTIVVGSEGQGLGPAIRRRCDLFMRIPMRGAIGSLNAAVAGSILLFEAVAQRDPEGLSTPPSAARSLTPDAAGSERRGRRRRRPTSRSAEPRPPPRRVVAAEAEAPRRRRKRDAAPPRRPRRRDAPPKPKRRATKRGHRAEPKADATKRRAPRADATPAAAPAEAAGPKPKPKAKRRSTRAPAQARRAARVRSAGDRRPAARRSRPRLPSRMARSRRRSRPAGDVVPLDPFGR